jgi:type I restriction enzyme S subunit
MIADKLKKSILQAAIQGKLTQQLPEDGDARDLLKEIRAEKERLIQEGKLKKEKPLPEITEDEIPFDIPENWCWVRLGDIFSIGSARRIHQRDWRPTGVPFYRAREIAKLATDGIVDNELFVERDLFEKIKDESGAPQAADLMVTGVGTLGKTYIVKESDEFYYKDASVLCFNNFSNINSEYAKYFMESPLMVGQMRSNSSGTTVATLTIERSREYFFPMPPIDEQNRIVEKLASIFYGLIFLEKDEKKLGELKKIFPKKMKDSILQAAIQGKLTEQSESDGDARDLLREIKAEKKRLIKEGKIKKGKPLPEITEDEIPFDIPDNWCWVRLGDIGDWAAGATPNRSNSAFFHNGKIPWLKTGDLNDGVIAEIPECITEFALKNTSVKLHPVGTVLIAMYGATIGKIGLLNLEATTNQACCGCITYKGIYNLYLFYYLMSHKKDFINQGAGGAQPNISKEKIIATIIPIPPLAEQYRIVERLAKLLPFCETLE